ncbi:nucleoside 2-deoxyribosyltransferase [Ligilactobacillus sp. Marseille-Q7487]|jgi:nucleoside deoxyribosyltransferase|uniref:nucleoside 2-deoxyribosyltransferase n=1 Tax=Ligilactobacillus sp. Marseille-Q7487 TaxID=3022128 RepID=UPI0024A8AA6D|nr:nucleoside 2-deoxyribosyltransferase [Ligilactobacillus sp. Marseille-Q7487]
MTQTEFEPSPVKAYIACSWFNEKQVAHMKAGLAAIEQNPSISRKFSHWPLDYSYKGLSVEEHPELLEDVEWQSRTYVSDIEGMMGADLGIMLYTPECFDDGVAFECGFLRGNNKQAVLVVPDDNEAPINLMVALGVTRVIKLSELATYDFRHVVSSTYQGKVI